MPDIKLIALTEPFAVAMYLQPIGLRLGLSHRSCLSPHVVRRPQPTEKGE
jgi:hypothetical protein